jgi:sugar O-acyltransferase (sialic acid O-acetyltransferase NeuD family)
MNMANKQKIVIFGTGDIAQIAKYYFDIDSDYEVAAFTADKAYMIESTFEGKPVIAFEELNEAFPPTAYKMFIAVSYASMNKFREKKYNEAVERGYDLVSYVSSKCSYMSQFPCGKNCFIFEDNTIQPFVHIKDNVTLWSGNHIGHHSTIESHNFISSHVVISGHCHIKSNCFLGVNATLHNNVTIEKETLVAAGAIIGKNSVEQGVYLPAKTILFDKRSNEINF